VQAVSHAVLVICLQCYISSTFTVPDNWHQLTSTPVTGFASLCLCSLTDSLTEPLKAELTDIEREISDQTDLNAALKSSLQANEDKILKMIRTAQL